nr:DNA polymerase III subunit beta [Deltaproteobacteria bacterium]
MKCSTFSKDITKCLQKVQSIIERKEIKPILSTVLLSAQNDSIQIQATNLEVSLRERCPATIVEEGRIVVDARKLYEIVKEMPDAAISLERKENNWVEISSGDILFELVGMDAKEFPVIEFFEQDSFQEIDAGILKNMIDKTLYAASTDERKQNLNGVFFHKTKKDDIELLRLVATDGHRLSIIGKPLSLLNEHGRLDPDQFDKGVIFPRRGLLELKKLLDDASEQDRLSYLCKKNCGLFKRGDTLLVIRIIDKEFPNYIQAIPVDVTKEIAISSEGLLRTLKRISVVAEEKSKAVNLIFSQNQLDIHASNPIIGQGRERLALDYTGESMKLGFNAGYLIDTLNALDGEKVLIRIKDQDSPVVFLPFDNEEHIGIIMPMEIED